MGTRRQGRNRARKTVYRGREENPWWKWLKNEQICDKKYPRKKSVQNRTRKTVRNGKLVCKMRYVFVDICQSL